MNNLILNNQQNIFNEDNDLFDNSYEVVIYDIMNLLIHSDEQVLTKKDLYISYTEFLAKTVKNSNQIQVLQNENSAKDLMKTIEKYWNQMDIDKDSSVKPNDFISYIFNHIKLIFGEYVWKNGINEAIHLCTKKEIEFFKDTIIYFINTNYDLSYSTFVFSQFRSKFLPVYTEFTKPFEFDKNDFSYKNEQNYESRFIKFLEILLSQKSVYVYDGKKLDEIAIFLEILSEIDNGLLIVKYYDKIVDGLIILFGSNLIDFLTFSPQNYNMTEIDIQNSLKILFNIIYLWRWVQNTLNFCRENQFDSYFDSSYNDKLYKLNQKIGGDLIGAIYPDVLMSLVRTSSTETKILIYKIVIEICKLGNFIYFKDSLEKMSIHNFILFLVNELFQSKKDPVTRVNFLLYSGINMIDTYFAYLGDKKTIANVNNSVFLSNAMSVIYSSLSEISVKLSSMYESLPKISKCMFLAFKGLLFSLSSLLPISSLTSLQPQIINILSTQSLSSNTSNDNSSFNSLIFSATNNRKAITSPAPIYCSFHILLFKSILLNRFYSQDPSILSLLAKNIPIYSFAYFSVRECSTEYPFGGFGNLIDIIKAVVNGIVEGKKEDMFNMISLKIPESLYLILINSYGDNPDYELIEEIIVIICKITSFGKADANMQIININKSPNLPVNNNIVYTSLIENVMNLLSKRMVVEITNNLIENKKNKFNINLIGAGMNLINHLLLSFTGTIPSLFGQVGANFPNQLRGLAAALNAHSEDASFLRDANFFCTGIARVVRLFFRGIAFAERIAYRNGEGGELDMGSGYDKVYDEMYGDVCGDVYDDIENIGGNEDGEVNDDADNNINRDYSNNLRNNNERNYNNLYNNINGRNNNINDNNNELYKFKKDIYETDKYLRNLLYNLIQENSSNSDSNNNSNNYSNNNSSNNNNSDINNINNNTNNINNINIANNNINTSNRSNPISLISSLLYPSITIRILYGPQQLTSNTCEFLEISYKSLLMVVYSTLERLSGLKIMDLSFGNNHRVRPEFGLKYQVFGGSIRNFRDIRDFWVLRYECMRAFKSRLYTSSTPLSTIPITFSFLYPLEINKCRRCSLVFVCRGKAEKDGSEEIISSFRGGDLGVNDLCVKCKKEIVGEIVRELQTMKENRGMVNNNNNNNVNLLNIALFREYLNMLQNRSLDASLNQSMLPLLMNNNNPNMDILNKLTSMCLECNNNMHNNSNSNNIYNNQDNSKGFNNDNGYYNNNNKYNNNNLIENLRFDVDNNRTDIVGRMNNININDNSNNLNSNTANANNNSSNNNNINDNNNAINNLNNNINNLSSIQQNNNIEIYNRNNIDNIFNSPFPYKSPQSPIPQLYSNFLSPSSDNILFNSLGNPSTSKKANIFMNNIESKSSKSNNRNEFNVNNINNNMNNYNSNNNNNTISNFSNNGNNNNYNTNAISNNRSNSYERKYSNSATKYSNDNSKNKKSININIISKNSINNNNNSNSNNSNNSNNVSQFREKNNYGLLSARQSNMSHSGIMNLFQMIRNNKNNNGN